MRAVSAGDPIDAERVRRAARQRLFAEAATPLVVGRFEVRAQLGAGGMGVVYAAYDAQLERTVAIKLLVEGGSLVDEARAMAAVRHPNLPAVYEVGEWHGRVFMAMEHVEGVTLRRYTGDKLAACVQAGRALGALHAAGLVHRDVKPDNIVVDARGRAVLVDFGLARKTAADDGRVAGTLPYVAPEVLAGGRPTAASDQYALCVALAELPLPARKRALVERGKRDDPARRFADVDALCDALERRPPWLAIAAGAIGIAAVVAVVVAWPAASPGCDDGGARLGWTDERRAAIAAALSASPLPYAATSRDVALARVDDYAREWRRAHLDACEATHERHEQSAELLDLRMICLDKRRTALLATADVLGRADTIERAVALVEALPPIAPCADPQALRSTAPPAEIRDKLAALEPRRATVAALTAAGDFALAIPTGEALVADARAVGYKPFEADALFALGTALAIADRPAAASSLFDAVKAAQASGYTDLVARASTRLVAYHAEHGHWGEAETLAGIAEASGGGAELDSAMISLLVERNHPDDARKRAEAGLAKVRTTPTILRATLLTNLGNALDELGRYDEALAKLRESLAMREKLLGSTHPDIARTLDIMAIIVEKQGHFDDALALYQRGAEVAAASLGRDSLLYAALLDNEAGCLRSLSRDPDALELRKQALAIREKLAPGSADLAISYNNVGVILEENHHYAEAKTYHQKALALRIAYFGDNHTEVATSWMNLGDVAFGEKDYTGMLAADGKAIAILEAALGKDHPSLIYPLIGAAKAHMALGDRRTAATELSRAIAIAEASKSRPELAVKARELLDRVR